MTARIATVLHCAIDANAERVVRAASPPERRHGLSRERGYRRLLDGVRRNDTRAADVLHGGFENFVMTRSNAGDRRRYSHLWHETDALQLSSVGVPHIMPGERHADRAREHDARDVTVRAFRLRANERGAVRGLEEEPRVLRLTDRAFIDEQHRLARVLR